MLHSTNRDRNPNAEVGPGRYSSSRHRHAICTSVLLGYTASCDVASSICQLVKRANYCQPWLLAEFSIQTDLCIICPARCPPRHQHGSCTFVS